LIARSAVTVRSRMLHAVRLFFLDRDFVEVETPVRIPAPAHERHIEIMTAGRGFLRSSPELHMKRLLAAGHDRIFQVGPCFRAGESGRLHNPEFTMLEWYRTGTDYRGVLEDARGLVLSVADEVLGCRSLQYGAALLDLSAEWAVMTIREAFDKWAGWDPVSDFEQNRFDLDLVEKIEPALPADRPAVLIDYPAAAAALARCRGGDGAVAERWELYIGGMELANAFSELTDAAEQRRRFEDCRRQRRAAGMPDHPMDEAFLEALAAGLPECGGAALGIDRLVMLLAGETDIGAVRPFCREQAT